MTLITVTGEDIMEVGIGKQPGQSSRETQADLKSCLRPLIASRALWGKENSLSVILVHFFEKICFTDLSFNVYLNKFDFDYEMFTIRVKDLWEKLSHTFLNLVGKQSF